MDKTTILEMLKYVIPAFVVFLTAFVMVKLYLDKDYDRRQFEMRVQNQKESLPIRLQAYERLALFLERISPNNIIQRVRKPNMTAKELHIALVQTIRMEFEHNLSQQIYVTPETWSMICFTKDEVIKIINLTSAALPPEASSMHLSKSILEYFIENEEPMPTQKAMDLIKLEVRKIYA
jgi:hypothetical protein